MLSQSARCDSDGFYIVGSSFQTLSLQYNTLIALILFANASSPSPGAGVFFEERPKPSTRADHDGARRLWFMEPTSNRPRIGSKLQVSTMVHCWGLKSESALPLSVVMTKLRQQTCVDRLLLLHHKWPWLRYPPARTRCPRYRVVVRSPQNRRIRHTVSMLTSVAFTSGFYDSIWPIMLL